MSSIFEYTTTTTPIDNSSDLIPLYDPRCKLYYTNTTGLVIKTYEGIPENFLVNLVVWLCLIILYTFLRKIGEYGRFGLVKNDEERFVFNFLKLKKFNLPDFSISISLDCYLSKLDKRIITISPLF